MDGKVLMWMLLVVIGNDGDDSIAGRGEYDNDCRQVMMWVLLVVMIVVCNARCGEYADGFELVTIWVLLIMFSVDDVGEGNTIGVADDCSFRSNDVNYYCSYEVNCVST